jgi:GDPmannose 4,6-dehydratase
VDPEQLLGDYTRAKRELGWRPKTKFEDLVKIMVAADVKVAKLILEGTRKHNEEWREHLV